MRSSIAISALIVPFFVSLSHAAQSYLLNQVMWGSTFFNSFDFVTTDPNNGYVKYLGQAAAQAAGLISAAEGAPARISADSRTVLSGAAGTGRNSVRIESKTSWTHGLFVFNIASMPAPACGVWPALWTLGPDWPNNGEIDLLEGINFQTRALYTLHTSSGCTVTKQNQLGVFASGQCSGDLSGNQGCGIVGSSDNTYGAGLNAAGGGDYVMEWTSSYIKIWWFPKSSIPADIASGKPDPTKWSTPQAWFPASSTCNLDSKFQSHKIILNINFCGDWAGPQFLTDATCKTKAATCADYVAKNPTAFSGASWSINSIKVYQLGTAKRGIEDPTLEVEKRSDAEVSQSENETTIEKRMLVEGVQAREENYLEAAKSAAHIHKHRHRSDRRV